METLAPAVFINYSVIQMINSPLKNYLRPLFERHSVNKKFDT
jgi:hypothetical protein